MSKRLLKSVFHAAEDTAEILHELNSQESRKGAAIEVPVELSPEKEQVIMVQLMVMVQLSKSFSCTAYLPKHLISLNSIFWEISN